MNQFTRLFGLTLLISTLSHPCQSAEAGLSIQWTNNILTIKGPDIPGGSVEIWYLEAFCRSDSTHREWNKTTIPHQTRLVSVNNKGTEIRLHTIVKPSTEIEHVIRAGKDEISFEEIFHNKGEAFADIQWYQPCVRVDGFTGRNQNDYWPRCFIFTSQGMRFLDQTQRAEDALYRGGQVYVPEGINLNDVNPRPVSPDRPVNGLMGCVSSDEKMMLAVAWDQTQELFQGVIVCLHNDPRVGGLMPGQKKRIRGKLYILPNDPQLLLQRYQSDFRPEAR